MNDPRPPFDPLASPVAASTVSHGSARGPARARSGRCFALVPCAGTGRRAALAAPKQYRELLGKPMVTHTLEALQRVARLAGTLVLTAPDDPVPVGLDAMESIALEDRNTWALSDFDSKMTSRTLLRADCGGATRARTVANGLARLRDLGVGDDDWVLVHDAARCVVTPASIDRLIDACMQDPVGGLLALPVADTLKVQAPHGANEGDAPRVPPRVGATQPRDGVWLAQTPQMFRLGLLERALADAASAGAAVTDEASAVERLGLAPRLVVGDMLNFKVTWPGDFAVAEAILRSRAP